jgi:hypothetical protein
MDFQFGDEKTAREIGCIRATQLLTPDVWCRLHRLWFPSKLGRYVFLYFWQVFLWL